MKEIEMPSLSPTMEEGKIIKWVKKEGDEVKRGDVIAEIETDKAAMEYESEIEGKIGKIIKKEGEEVKVGEVIGLMLEEGDREEEIEKYKGKEERKESNNKVIQQVEEPVVKGKQEIETSNTNYLSNKESSRIFISPLARTIATQNNVDISKVHGTGPNNRIVKADILSYLKMGNESENTSQHSFNNNLDEAPYRDIKNTAMRKTIAKRLLESKTSIPHYYLTMDCIVDELLRLRVTINNNAKGKYKISINDIIIKALALAMRDMPEANSYWKDNFTREFLRQDVAVAVAIPNGLVTPIIKDAANKGLIEISNEMKDLANRAKLGTLKFNEIQGGGFSLSNLGMYGVENFAAIINPPQAGILAVSAVHKKPAVVNDEIVIANILNLTLSADHRVLDGASAAIFLNKIKNYLETPASMLL